MPPRVPKKIRPSSAQLAPQNGAAPGTSQIVATAPPPVGAFLILLSAMNPIQAPSGEKNGAVAPSVPGIGAASLRSSVRSYSCDRIGAPAGDPTNTRRRPSGDRAIEMRAGRSPANVLTAICAAGSRPVCRCVTGLGSLDLRGSTQPSSTPPASTTTIHGSAFQGRCSADTGAAAAA